MARFSVLVAYRMGDASTVATHLPMLSSAMHGTGTLPSGNVTMCDRLSSVRWAWSRIVLKGRLPVTTVICNPVLRAYRAAATSASSCGRPVLGTPAERMHGTSETPAAVATNSDCHVLA